MIELPPELMGSFYLGAEVNASTGEMSQIPVNYDARDLVTHAVCVGMTGSGKTGLCIGLLEEAALDKVPAIIIDPKGDMTNLLLQFENIQASDFEPWVNADDARRKDMSTSEYAAQIANTWKKGLADWGQGNQRIQALKNSVDYTIFTPGSNSGIPINILGSFAAPKEGFDHDIEQNLGRIQGIVASLLGMIGSKEDPVKSREGILLSSIFEFAWRHGQSLDMASIILSIQNPPIKKLGVFDVDTFYPSKDRFSLAMEFNTLVASPQFKYWLEGEPLDIQSLYFTKQGKPRHSIFYIAHLSDSERMFFVTLLLNSVIGWMRAQSGTTSLRSLLYFDEIFGYFPPTAEPPSKKPLLTLLKQARAFGLGTVLVTQNPVDIDYKGLSNAGTWFIGKLQTERDKMRVKDGLEGAIADAGGKLDIDLGNIISGLKSRTFLMHNVHDEGPTLFHTRWAISYLRGPLTKPQIKQLMDEKRNSSSHAHIPNLEITNPSSLKVQHQHADQGPPALDPDIPQRYLIPEPGTGKITFRPLVLGLSKVRFYDAKRGIDEVQNINLLCPTPDEFGRINWDKAIKMKDIDRKLVSQPMTNDASGISYENIPPSINSAKELITLQKDFSDYLYRSQSLKLNEFTAAKLVQHPSETDEEFKGKLHQLIREKRDEVMDEIREKYRSKIDKIEDKIRKEERDLQQAEDEARDRKRDEFLNMAGTIFSVLGGRKRSLSTASTKRRMTRKAGDKIDEAREELELLEEDYREMQDQLQRELDDISAKFQNVDNLIAEFTINPRKTDIIVDNMVLVWYPAWN